MHLSRFSAYGIDNIQNGSYFQYHRNKQFRGSTEQNTTGRPTHTSVIKLYGIKSYIEDRTVKWTRKPTSTKSMPVFLECKKKKN